MMLGRVLDPLTIADVFQAEQRLRKLFAPSPMLHMAALDQQLGCEVYLKADCLLPTGAFKLRGAYNKTVSLIERFGRDITLITTSSGNHGMAVSYSASIAGVKAYVAVPVITPDIKKNCIRGFGAELIEYGQTYDEAFPKAVKLAEDNGYYYLHATADRDTIAGQGTISLEILDQLPDVEQVVVPVGGGGLIAGIAYAMKTLKPDVKLVGVMPKGSAAYYECRKAGKLVTLEHAATVADAVIKKEAEPYLFPYVEEYVDELLVVEEDSIYKAMQYALLYAKLGLEGAGALALAAVLEGQIDTSKKTVLMASGGNVDSTVLSRCLMQ